MAEDAYTYSNPLSSFYTSTFFKHKVNTKHFVVPSANTYDCVVCILVTMMLKYACAQASAIVKTRLYNT